MRKSLRLLFAGTLIMLTTLACTVGGLTLNKDNASLEVKLTEDQLQSLVVGAGSVADNVETAFLDHVDKIELHDGFMRVFGTANYNGKDVEGSMDVSLSAVDGKLAAEIISVDIPDMDMNDPAVQYANDMIESQLSRQLSESQGDVRFDKAEVTEDALILNMKVKLNNNSGQ